MDNIQLKKYKKIKYFKLIAAIVIDVVGIVTYFIPAIAESGDWVWAPISGVLILLLFPNHKKMAIAGVLEEILPFTDIMPTALLAWRLDYMNDKEEKIESY